MNLNIYAKIFELMEIYENLLLEKTASYKKKVIQ